MHVHVHVCMCVCVCRSSSPVHSLPNGFIVGAHVISRYHALALWHRGRITQTYQDNTVDVVCDEGLQEHKVPVKEDRIRLVSQTNQDRSRRVRRRNQFLYNE